MAQISLLRPKGLIAGFHADAPESAVPWLTHCGEQWLPEHWRIAPHRHEVWEFYLQVSGQTRWRVSGQDYQLSRGHFLAVGPGVEHWLIKRPHGEHHILFAGLDLRAVWPGYGELKEVWSRADHYVVAQAGAVEGPFSDLMQEVTGRRPWRADGIRLAIEQLVLAVTRLLVPGMPGGSELYHPATTRACYLIECEPERDWRLDELACAAGISASHLRRCFQRDLGVSPQRFIRDTRLERACRMLADSDASITMIALELGFSSSQHFAQAFRKHKGMTPRAYRQSAVRYGN